MTTSDIERTLAEARAAAARRLEALRDAQPAPVAQAQPAAAVEHVFVPRREPDANAGLAAPEIAVAPPVQERHPAQPDAAAPSVTPYEAQSAPMVAHAMPTPAYRDAAHGDDLQYAAYEPVGAPRAAGEAAAAYVPVDPLPRPRLEAHGSVGGYEEAQFGEPVRKPGFMAGVVAGFAAFRRSRAERRALARETALQSAGAATPHLNQQRLSAKEQRWERRRKRYLFEEILGWILVPIILVALYFFALWILDLFGTTPDALIEGMQTIWSRFR